MVEFNLIYLCASNDTNGNPRRGWFEIDGFGRAQSYWSEGYAGSGVLPERLKNASFSTPRINVSAKELKSWIKSVDPANQID